MKSMYLVSIYFDADTERVLQSYINQVAKVTGNTFMTDERIPPHITVLGFETREEEKAIELMDLNIKKIKRGQIYLASLGVFKRQVIYVQPILNEYIHQLSNTVYGIYEDIPNVKFNPYYKPFSWIPHMSVGKHLDDKQMEQAFSVLVKQFVPIKAEITRIGFARTNPHEDIKLYEL